MLKYVHGWRGRYKEKKTTLIRRIKKWWHDFRFTKCIVRTIPVLGWLPNYSLENNLFDDVLAGIAQPVMHIPKGMAYGLLACGDAKVGLHMAFFPVLVYFVFGITRHNSMGTLSIVSIMVDGIVATYESDPIDLVDLNATSANADDIIYTPLQIATAVTFFTCVFYFTMFLIHLNIITSLLNDSIVSGFLFGTSIYIFVSQLKDIFGIPVTRQKGVFRLIRLLRNLIDNIRSVNNMAVIISCITIFYLLIMIAFIKPWLKKKFKFPLIPIDLVAVIVGSTSSYFLDFRQSNVVELVGTIPAGLPEPEFPPLKLIGIVAPASIIVAIISYSITISVGVIFAKKANYTISANQELLAFGAANMIGSIFSCIPVSASLSRTTQQYESGGKTQLTSVFSALIILCVLLWIAPLLEWTPRCVLSAIVVVSLKGIYQEVFKLKKFYKTGKDEAAVWLITLLAVLFINIDYGLLVGVMAFLIVLLVHSLKSSICELGQISDSDSATMEMYVNLKKDTNAKEIPNIKIYQYCGSINLANRFHFRKTMYKKIKRNDIKLQIEMEDKVAEEFSGLFAIILDLSRLKHMDTNGYQTVSDIQYELVEIGFLFLLACPSDKALNAIENGNALGIKPIKYIFPTIYDAVIFAQGYNREAVVP